VISGRIEHRLLMNYRADPEVVRRLLPSPFRPQVLDGRAVVGVCLIRLSGLRPRGAPARLGLQTDNAAHRFAVEWDTDDGVSRGVYIARRDSDSLITTLAGGRLFPGVHHRAHFDVGGRPSELHIGVQSRDGRVAIDVDVDLNEDGLGALAGSELFHSASDASAFFEGGSIGWSPDRRGTVLQGVELCTDAWHVEPVTVRAASSSYFDDETLFPKGSIELDCALVMRGVPVIWRRTPDIRREDVAHVRDRRIHRGVPAGAPGN
jgi:hypothetical protein